MTHPDAARSTEDETAVTAQDQLRATLLTSGLHDLVPLAEVESAITDCHLAPNLAAQQVLALQRAARRK